MIPTLAFGLQVEPWLWAAALPPLVKVVPVCGFELEKPQFEDPEPLLISCVALVA